MIETANLWLQRNAHWEVINCETVMLLYKYNDRGSYYELKPNDSTFYIYGTEKNNVLRALRLWIKRREVVPVNKDTSDICQVLNYLDVIPLNKDDSDYSGTKFENLDELVERVNANISNNGIDGRIITLETLQCEAGTDWKVDPEVSLSSFSSKNMFILRIFYEQGTPCDELINVSMQTYPFAGIVDFVPKHISGGGFFRKPKFETYSEVMSRATKWLSQNPDVNFKNAQSVDIKLKSWNSKESEVDYRNMFFKKSKSDFLLKFIRVFYATENTEVNCDKLVSPPKPVLLNCKIFVPAKLGPQEYEDCIGTKRKMEAWLTATGAHIVSAETSVIKLSYSTSSIAASVDSMFTSLSSNSEGSHWIVIYRIYIDGQYLEPPLRVLPSYPQDPEPDEQSCTIS
ncbi:hypothetical protein B4U80_10132 [Leptotrombidium deliense]|uniref:Uncharacterized protein n=1 Tax=Leptotrombidium deliense TaxID=299467 RepID=A0A443SP46_9ACAR|nr:hypothetical protein B4U80_10132 [Leptotrombidium deliense]